MGHLCSLRMNRPVISIARTLIRFSTSLLVCNKSRVAPWCSSLMTQRLPAGQEGFFARSEERRVGKECRRRRAAKDQRKKEKRNRLEVEKGRSNRDNRDRSAGQTRGA